MSRNRIIQFEYRTKDGVIQPNNSIISLSTEKIIINGQLTKKVFDPVKIRPVIMTGLFITYHNIEYGSITTNEQELLSILNNCYCVEDEFRIFDEVFEKEFE